jgi:hypothetical protein
MKRMIAALALIASPALADGEFSAGSEAQSWGLLGEEQARFEGRVIDVVCHLTGDCPADCGAGKRQIGILRSADGRFLLANKNVQPVFSGAAVDLAPYCGQTVEIDGLLVGDSELTPSLRGMKLLQVQTVRAPGAAEAQKTVRWTKAWAARNPGVGGEGPWNERDPRILEQIELHGRLGIGQEADQKFIEENF